MDIFLRKTFIGFSLVLITLFFGCRAENPLEGNNIEATSSSITSASLNTTNTQTINPTSEEKSKQFTKNNLDISDKDFKRVDGSTATIPLSEAVAVELLGLKPEEGSHFIRHNTTHMAYERLIHNEVDIIFVTEPSKDELELAKINNIELEVIPVVKDAFVFLVNKKNNIESLTVKQIQNIYSGKLTNWNQVGGSEGKILAYQRPENSGSQTLMLSKVMKDIPMVTPEKHMEPAGMGQLIEVVAGFDNSEFALGYSVYYYASAMYIRDTIKLIGVDGVKPEPDTIKTNQYPLTSAYYAVLRKNEPENSVARRLLKWVLSEQGQKVAEKAGYVPLK